jgi:hypothetical protein
MSRNVITKEVACDDDDCICAHGTACVGEAVNPCFGTVYTHYLEVYPCYLHVNPCFGTVYTH